MSGRPPWAAATTGIRIRRAQADDHSAIAAFLGEMDSDGLYQRHFAHGDAPNLALLDRLAGVDGLNRVMLVAVDAASRVVGHAEYVSIGSAAEFAFMVLPRWRGCGIGKALLDALVDVAFAAGLQQLHGLVLATNTGAQLVSRKSGFRLARGDDARTVIVSRLLAPETVADQDGPAYVAQHTALPTNRHDPDRIPLYRCAGP